MNIFISIASRIAIFIIVSSSSPFPLAIVPYLIYVILISHISLCPSSPPATPLPIAARYAAMRLNDLL